MKSDSSNIADHYQKKNSSIHMVYPMSAFQQQRDPVQNSKKTVDESDKAAMLF